MSPNECSWDEDEWQQKKIEQKLKKFLGGGTSNQVKEMDLLVKEEYDTLFHFLLLAKS